MPFIIIVAVGIVGALVHLAASRTPRSTARVLEILLLWALITNGLLALLAFTSHVFNGPATARYIGWPAGSPFQLEIGMANLSIAVLSLMCIRWRGNFWLATIVFTTVLYWGAAWVHIDQIIRVQNYAPGNAGPPLYSDIIFPVVLIGLYVAYGVAQRRQAARPAAVRRAA